MLEIYFISILDNRARHFICFYYYGIFGRVKDGNYTTTTSPSFSTESNDRGNIIFIKRLETFVLSAISKFNIIIIIIIPISVHFSLSASSFSIKHQRTHPVSINNTVCIQQNI